MNDLEVLTMIPAPVPAVWPDDRPRVRSTDPIASHEAADSNENRALVEAFVKGLFVEYGTMTDAELTNRYFDEAGHPSAAYDTPRKRRSELAADGVLVKMGKRRGPTGRRVEAYGIAHPFAPVPTKDVA